MDSKREQVRKLADQSQGFSIYLVGTPGENRKKTEEKTVSIRKKFRAF